MPRTPTALVTPEILSWARESYGLETEEAAKSIGISKSRLLSWEIGKDRPSIAQSRKMAEVYKQPLAVFFLPRPPRDFPALRDFRRLARSEKPPLLSPELRREIRKARELREAALDLIENEEQVDAKSKISATLSGPPEELAQSIREVLNITAQNQFSWKSYYKAFNSWRDAIEEINILVIYAQKVNVREMRGFSISDLPVPIIVINSKDSIVGKTFTLLHELVHIYIHQGGLCQWINTDYLHGDERRVEIFCNHVAGAALVPRNQLLENSIVKSKGHSYEWSDEELRRLARVFSVSREVILRRLLICGRTSDEFYRGKREQFLKEYEPVRDTSFRPNISYERRIVNTLGRGYVRLVLNSYYEKRITLSSVADFLRVRLRHVPAIEHEVRGWS